MPELPEVEITRLGILKRLQGRCCTGAVVRETRFRKKAPSNLSALLKGQKLIDIERRGKYLLWKFENSQLFSHLGMSGVMRVLDAGTPPEPHDHIDLLFGDLILRYHDPRRFGFLVWAPKDEDLHRTAEIAKLGAEPFSDEFTASYLKASFARTAIPVKEALLSGRHVVGAGNIYCSESLFEAGIHPKTAANRISLKRLSRLVEAVRKVLELSLQEGGSTLRDFVSAEGEEGYFTLNAKVYAKEGKPCVRCGTPIRKIVQKGRATYYCPHCQK